MAMTDENLAVLTEKIEAIMESGVSQSFIETVLKRLDSFGYVPDENADAFSIAFAIQRTELTVRNECNTSGIPLGLICHAVDMACGEFLSAKHKSGQLELEALELDNLSSVDIGDTSVSFDTGASDEGKLELLITSLKNAGRGEFACYRQLRW